MCVFEPMNMRWSIFVQRNVVCILDDEFFLLLLFCIYLLFENVNFFMKKFIRQFGSKIYWCKQIFTFQNCIVVEGISTKKQNENESKVLSKKKAKPRTENMFPLTMVRQVRIFSFPKNDLLFMDRWSRWHFCVRKCLMTSRTAALCTKRALSA